MMRRPGWVWVISVFYFLSALWTLYGWYSVASGKIPLTPQVRAYMTSLTVFDYALAVIQSILSLSAAVTLFLLRKAAYPLFLAALIAAFLTTLWHVLSHGWFGAMASVRGGLFGAVLGIFALSAVCLYASSLREQGKLR